jgi:hypothetical protein
MLARYVKATGDTSILARGIPLAEVSLSLGGVFWFINLSVERAKMVVE